jgi:hypothetical protein
MTVNCLIIGSTSAAFDSYSYYRDWQDSFIAHPALQTQLLDIQDWRLVRRAVTLRGRYDLIVFLHSVYATMVGSSRMNALRLLLARVRGPRVFFLANEFRDLRGVTEVAGALGARWLISQLTEDASQMLYQSLWDGKVMSLPYGFNPQVFKPTVALAERPIDIGFRGDYYPAYVGHDDRGILLDSFKEAMAAYPEITTDIQVGQRLDHHGWAAFLNQCRALIGHEAGGSRIDADDNIRMFLNAQEGRMPVKKFRSLVLALRRLGVFEPPPTGRIAAPRNFEAMGTKTVQILLPGRYNDLLEPGVHYIELQRDFSNLEAVLETLKDDAAYTRIAERAYADALAQHTYEQRIGTLLRTILG